MIYLDNNATTSVAEEVREAMSPFLGEAYGNPSSPYTLARRSALAIADARHAIARSLGVSDGEIIFTSGGTEGNNTAIASLLSWHPSRRRIVTTAIEHPSVLEPCRRFERQGYEVIRLRVDQAGALDLDEVRANLGPETAALIVMAANNETGVVLPLEQIAAMARDAGTPMHVDAVQAFGKLPGSVVQAGVMSASFSAHKLHGPKGIGCIFVARTASFAPLLLGGEQEHGRRGGTENVMGIAGFGRAVELAETQLARMQREVRALRDRFEELVLSGVPGVRIVGRDSPRLPNTSLLLCEGLESDAILPLLDMEGVCCSSGSACASGSAEPSHVLLAMGFSVRQAKSAVRFSFGRMNTEGEVAAAADSLQRVVRRLRAG